MYGLFRDLQRLQALGSIIVRHLTTTIVNNRTRHARPSQTIISHNSRHQKNPSDVYLLLLIHDLYRRHFPTLGLQWFMEQDLT